MNFAGGLQSRSQPAEGHGGIYGYLQSRRERIPLTKALPDAGELFFQFFDDDGYGVSLNHHLRYAAGQIAQLGWNEDRGHNED